MLSSDHEETGGRGDHENTGLAEILDGLRTFTAMDLGS